MPARGRPEGRQCCQAWTRRPGESCFSWRPVHHSRQVEQTRRPGKAQVCCNVARFPFSYSRARVEKPSAEAYNPQQRDQAVRVLLVEDEHAAAQMLAKGLREQGYAVDVADDGEDGANKASVNQYDVIILDVLLPRKDGFSVCRELRASGLAIPILMLTARDAVEDRIAGLDHGADDYLTKPFEYRELLARVRALLRRGPAVHINVIDVGDLHIDVKARRGGGGRAAKQTPTRAQAAAPERPTTPGDAGSPRETRGASRGC